MTFYQSEVVLKKKPAKLEAGACIVQQRSVFTLPIGKLVNGSGTVTNAFAVGNIIEALVLPADHTIVDARIDCDKLDAATSGPSPALAFDVGIMSGVVGLKDTSRTVGAQLFSGATTAQAGGASASPSLRAAYSILASNVDRSIGIKITAAAATALTLTAASKFVRNVGFWQPGTVYAVGDFFFLADGRRVFVDTGNNGTSGTNPPLEALGALAFASGSNTTQEGGVTWTMGDPYIALAVSYRSMS